MVDVTVQGALDGQEDGATRRARRLELDGSPPTAGGGFAKSLARLGEALGVSKSRAGQLANEEWFPRRSERGWDIDVCLRARAAHDRGEATPALAPVAPPAPPAPGAPGAPSSLPASYPPPLSAPPGENPLMDARREQERLERQAAEADRDLLAELASATDMVQIAKAACLLHARRLSRAPGGRADDLKKGLEEWRRMEADALELSKARGELVARDILSSLGGQLGARMVGALERLDGRFAGQVEAWVGDARFLALTTEARAREVGEWTRRTTRAAREVEADEVERIVKAEIAERAEP